MADIEYRRSAVAKGSVVHTALYHSPCGDMLLGELDGRLCLCDWVGGKGREKVRTKWLTRLGATLQSGPTGITNMATSLLDEYFKGRRTTFEVPLLFCGTQFQLMVWDYLAEIAYGSAMEYGQVARAVENRRATRAVAAACHNNVLSIFVPCHRVVGKGGRLVGYGGGLPAKQYLLQLEQGDLPLFRSTV